jgi:hypothetical protein
MQGWKDFFMAGSLSGCFERCINEAKDACILQLLLETTQR